MDHPVAAGHVQLAAAQQPGQIRVHGEQADIPFVVREPVGQHDSPGERLDVHHEVTGQHHQRAVGVQEIVGHPVDQLADQRVVARDSQLLGSQLVQLSGGDRLMRPDRAEQSVLTSSPPGTGRRASVAR
jgi:hypothetical protein